MSWSISVWFVADASITDLAPIGVHPARDAEPVTGDQASSSLYNGEGHVFAVERNGGIIITDPHLLNISSETEFAAATGKRVTSAILSGTSDMYAWLVTEPGGKVREFVTGEGTNILDVGMRGPEEEGVDTLDEDALFTMFAQVSGVRINGDEFLHTNLTPLTWPHSGLG